MRTVRRLGGPLKPEWWNGRHDGLKIRCSQEREGSSPSSGTRFAAFREPTGSTPETRGLRLAAGYAGTKYPTIPAWAVLLTGCVN